jgi:probable rRNA maturation factor
MIPHLINQSSVRMPKKYMMDQCVRIEKLLRKMKVQNLARLNLEVTIVFLDPNEAKAMNFQYRQKKYATDVLSFDGDFFESMGELVLCPQVLKTQSLQHDLSFRQELSYMLIHGVLHLLGYDHETNEKDAQRMFHIQDSIFDKIVNL